MAELSLYESALLPLIRVWHQSVDPWYYSLVSELLFSVILVWIKVYLNRLIGLVGSVHQWSGRPGFNPRSNHTKDFKNGTKDFTNGT